MPKKSGDKRMETPDLPKQPAGEPFEIDTIEQLKALAHPLRQQLLKHFAVKPATAKQAAEALGYQPTRLYHHVAKLEQAGMIELVETRPVRGTTEKYYSTVATSIKVDPRAFEDGPAKQLSKTVGMGVVDSLLTNVRREVADYLEEYDEQCDTGSESGMESEVLFAQAEIEADEPTVLELREKIARLIEEVRELSDDETRDAEKTKKYRLVVGWYPRASI